MYGMDPDEVEFRDRMGRVVRANLLSGMCRGFKLQTSRRSQAEETRRSENARPGFSCQTGRSC